MRAFVITIIGLPLSEEGASRCIEAARQFDLDVELFPATSRYEAEAVLGAEDLSVNRRIYNRISDEPIGDRDRSPKGSWHLTTPEAGCFLSHYRLWKLCADVDEPVAVFEHDVRQIAPLPPLIPTVLVLSLMDHGQSGTGGYLIAPEGARKVIGETRRNGIQPSDEVLWKSAFPSRQMAYCHPPVIAIEDGGISTVQFTRCDNRHEAIRKLDPWSDYVPPK